MLPGKYNNTIYIYISTPGTRSLISSPVWEDGFETPIAKLEKLTN